MKHLITLLTIFFAGFLCGQDFRKLTFTQTGSTYPLFLGFTEGDGFLFEGNIRSDRDPFIGIYSREGVAITGQSWRFNQTVDDNREYFTGSRKQGGFHWGVGNDSYPNYWDWQTSYSLFAFDVNGTELYRSGFRVDDRELRIIGCIPFEDGAIDAVGISRDTITGEHNGTILRFNPEGRLLRAFGFDNELGVRTLILGQSSPTEDGSVVYRGVSGKASLTGEDQSDHYYYVFKVDANGDLVWSFGIPLPYNSYTVFRNYSKVVVDDEGAAYFSVDSREQLGNNTIYTHREQLVVKVSASGTVEFANRYMLDGMISDHTVVVPGRNGEVLLRSEFRGDGNQYTYTIARIDAEGEVVEAYKLAHNYIGAALLNFGFAPSTLHDGYLMAYNDPDCGGIVVTDLDAEFQGLPGCDVTPVPVNMSAVAFPVVVESMGRLIDLDFAEQPAVDYFLTEPNVAFTNVGCIDAPFRFVDTVVVLCNQQTPVMPIGDLSSVQAPDDTPLTLTVSTLGQGVLRSAEVPGIEVLGQETASLTINLPAGLPSEQLATLIASLEYQAINWAELTNGVEFSMVYNGGCRAVAVSEIITALIPPILPGATIDVDTLVCPSEVTLLEVGRNSAESFLWSTGAMTPTINVMEAGAYSVILNNGCGSDTAYFNVIHRDVSPLTDAAESFLLCWGDSLQYRPTANLAEASQWSDGEIGERTLRSAGTYLIERSNGCYTAETRIDLEIQNCCEVYLPTAFSPNGDGINDHFKIFLHEVYCGTEPPILQVYDRWGGMVFSGSGEIGWDGKNGAGRPANPGVYTYVCQYSNGQRMVSKGGVVSLLR